MYQEEVDDKEEDSTEEHFAKPRTREPRSQCEHALVATSSYLVCTIIDYLKNKRS